MAFVIYTHVICYEYNAAIDIHILKSLAILRHWIPSLKSNVCVGLISIKGNIHSNSLRICCNRWFSAMVRTSVVIESVRSFLIGVFG